MKDMLERFVKNYEENIMRRYNGEKMLPFIDMDRIAKRPKRVIPLVAPQTPAPTTVLYPAGYQPNASYTAGITASPAVVPMPSSPGDRSQATTAVSDTSITLPAVLVGALIVALAVLFAIMAQGQPGTLNLFGKTFSGNLPLGVCLLGCLLPVAVSTPFYWLGANPGQKMLFGSAVMSIVGFIVWWLIHSTNWIVLAVEPMWALILIFITCIAAVGAWFMINMKEG